MSKKEEKKVASKKAASKKETKTAKKEEAEPVKATSTKKATKTAAKPKKETAKKEPAKKEVKKEAPKKETTKKEPAKKEPAKKAEPKKKEEIKPEAKKVTPAKEEPKKAEPKKEEPKKEPAKKAPAKKEVSKPAKTPEEKEEEPSYLVRYGDIKLFNKWSYKDLVVTDIGLQAYICLKPVITPHTGGRYEHQRFKKAEMPIAERLVNKLMRKRKGTGKKERMIKSVKIAFEIIHLKTGKNPIQVLIDAIQNAAPREEVTRITYGGMAQLQSVDVAPMRRLDIALTNIVEGVYKKAFNNILSAEEILAQELIDASDNKSSSFAINKMLEIERVALSAR
jgi:small subunit ribosomal protein S7